MSFIVEAKSFTPAPVGTHQGVCVDAVDDGVKDGPHGERHSMYFAFELGPTAGALPNGSRYTCRLYCSVSLDPRAKLRGILQTWRGRDLSAAELQGFDIEQMIDQPCTVIIVAGQPNKLGKPTTRVQSVLPADPKRKLLATGEYVRKSVRAQALSAQPLPPAIGAAFDIDTGEPETRVG